MSSRIDLPGIAVAIDGRVIVEDADAAGGDRFAGKVLRGAARRRVLRRLAEAALEAAAHELGRQRAGRVSDRTSSRRGA